jgi:hypothetical protein
MDLNGLPTQPRLTPSASIKDIQQDRNTSAETDVTPKQTPSSQSGARKNKFQIGAPKNYDKIKSIRDQRVKDRAAPRMFQAPEPVCSLPLTKSPSRLSTSAAKRSKTTWPACRTPKKRTNFVQRISTFSRCSKTFFSAS